MHTPKNYNPYESEAKWRNYWEKYKIYKFSKFSTKPVFSIDTPPPTVSGKMHLGHAFQYSQMDFIARYKRMNGYNLFYPFGTDDNGLATNKLVEKINNIKASNMQRKSFIDLCQATLKKIRPDFIQDWKNLAISCDYSLFYSTIDDHSRKISQQSFINLYKIGREYRKEAPTIWCPECQTAIAQVELEDKELPSNFNTLIFRTDKKDISIATTRPELLPACVSIFIHPEDERYNDLIGQEAVVPYFDFKVPILADDKVDITKGTGIVMCCTFGDLTDVEWFYKHNLPLKIAITKDGRMTELAGKYKDLTVKEARKQIIEDFKRLGLITEQKPLIHPVNVHERCGTEIEFLVTKQWFIKYLDLKDKFLEIGKLLKWNPDFMKVRYDNWIKGLQWDWCISRQRYFGVPFPVWYCKKCGEIILAEEKQLPVDPLIDKPKKSCKCGSKEFIPEEDVLDTWATSSLTPQIAISLRSKKLDKKFYPMNLRPQAHDIITFWLFNTVVKSLLHENQIPWKNIMISGFVLDPKGQKMSKSKGNVIDPSDIIKVYGADALRFWAGSTKLGSDNPFKEKEVVAGQKFIVKLWNASKFASLHLKDFKKQPKNLEATDLFLLSKLQGIIDKSTKSFEEYDYSRTKAEVENFFWHTFCNNYLEIIKDRLYNPDRRGKESRQSAQYTLYTVLLSILKLMAPILPHITEELYQLYFKKTEKEKSIHLTNWPKVNNELINKKLEAKGEEFLEIISKIRQFKNKHKKSLRTPVILTLKKSMQKNITPFFEDLKAAIQAQEIKFSNKFNVKFVSQ